MTAITPPKTDSTSQQRADPSGPVSHGPAQPWKPSFGPITHIGPRILIAFGVVMLGLIISFFFFNSRFHAAAPNTILPTSPPTISPVQSQRTGSVDWYQHGNNGVAGYGSPQVRASYRPGQTPPPLPPPGGRTVVSAAAGTTSTGALSPGQLAQLGSGPSTGNYAVPGLNGLPAGTYGQPMATPTPHRMTVAFLAPQDMSTTREAASDGSNLPLPTPPPADLPTPQANSDDYATGGVQRPRSPYELQAGSVIPAALAGSITSDLAGTPRAVVTENIYDSINQRHLLIPAGSRLLGSYAQGTVYGQNRLFIVWNRLFLPDGNYVDLGGMQSTDQAGSAGLNAKVDAHTGNKLGNVLLLSAIQAGLGALGGNGNSGSGSGTTIIISGQPSITQTLAQSVSTQLGNLAASMTQQALSQAPTLQISAGARFNIAVEKDLVFPGEYNAP
jgi:type IV secretory pathway VirB10-like protein